MQIAVIFDVDGVLVDSFAAHRDSWIEAAAEAGVEMTEEQFAATFGRTSREIIRAFWGDGLDEAAMRGIDERKEALYRRRVADDLPIMDGAIELVDALHADGIHLGVGSSGPRANIDLTLEGLGRANRFEAVVTGQDVVRGKPDPEVFLLGATRLGIPASRCAVIEDAPAGIAAARAAGMLAVALLGTATREALADADLVVASLRELDAGTFRERLERRDVDEP